MDIDLITTDREQALAMLDEDRLDLAVGWFDRPPNRFGACHLFEEALVGLCRRGHPLAKKRGKVDLKTILSFPHLVVSAANDRKAAFDTMLSRQGVERHSAISVSNFSAVPNLLLGSDLVGVYTQRVADVLARDFDLTTLKLPTAIPTLDHYLVWRNRYDADQRHIWLRDQVATAASNT